MVSILSINVTRRSKSARTTTTTTRMKTTMDPTPSCSVTKKRKRKKVARVLFVAAVTVAPTRSMRLVISVAA